MEILLWLYSVVGAEEMVDMSFVFPKKKLDFGALILDMLRTLRGFVPKFPTCGAGVLRASEGGNGGSAGNAKRSLLLRFFLLRYFAITMSVTHHCNH